MSERGADPPVRVERRSRKRSRESTASKSSSSTTVRPTRRSRSPRASGVTQFVSHPKNRGLAHSLRDGIQRALELGADILVLTDGDNQYPQERIPDLVRPILEGRPTRSSQTGRHRPSSISLPAKKVLQKLGTKVMNLAAGTDLPDGTSGFRAYSKEAAIKLNLIGRFNFAAETTIQAANKRLSFATITIETNPKTRESRLFKSSWEHVRKRHGGDAERLHHVQARTRCSSASAVYSSSSGSSRSLTTCIWS